MKKRAWVILGVLAIALVGGLLLWRMVHSEGQLLQRGRELLKEAPKEGTSEWQTWFDKLSKEDKMAWAQAADEAEKGPEPTEADKAAVKVADLPPGQSKVFKATLLESYKPLLQPDRGDRSVRVLQIETVRGPSGLESTMWARRASAAIKVGWGDKSVAYVKADNAVDVGGPASQWLHPGMGFWGGPAGGGRLVVKVSDTVSFKMPWDRPSQVFTLAVAEGYDYVFGTEVDKADRCTKAVVVASISQKRVVDIITTPSTEEGLNCMFDKDEGYLLVVDGSWKWMLMLDLKAEGKPAAQMKMSE